MNSSINVRIIARNIETGKITKQIEKHNIVSKQAVLTLIRVMNGEFSDTNSFNINRTKRLMLDDYIPKYFAMGSNIATGSAPGTTSIPTFNDTRLLSEFTDYPRMRISQRNIIESDQKITNPYIKLVIKHYVPVNAYVNMSIAEAGLFMTETGNTAWARVSFDRFIKDPVTVIDVEWEITLVSLESSEEANVSIDKSSLYSSIEDTLRTFAQKDSSLEPLTIALNKGITDMNLDEITQNEIDTDTNTIKSFIS